jgi:glutamate-5-semialdehyde dehydrogenase
MNSNHNHVLRKLSELLKAHQSEIISENQKDLESCNQDDKALYDRLKVDETKITSMINCVEQALDTDDILGKTIYSYQHPKGMLIENKIVPFGKIFIIYESRPDVTIEAAVMAFKAGNKIVLKGGKESLRSNLILVKIWHQALSENGFSEDHVVYLDVNREEIQEAIAQNTYKADLIIPRGGDQLIDFVKKNSNIPVLISGRGNNFLYVDEEADFEMAKKIILNGKSRISVCNALDKVILNKKLPNLDEKIKDLVRFLQSNQLDVFGYGEILNLNSDLKKDENPELLKEEFLSEKIVILIVNSLEEAIEIINENSGGHSASIITTNKTKAEKFQTEVDCGAVYHNASTRFTDGGEFGLSGEIAISTQKLHFRGPLGIHQLTTNKWFISGNGEIR